MSNWTARFVQVLGEAEGPQKREERPFFDSGEFEDFSLGRVLLGYGLPTLAALVLATVCFCYRDL
ncbi:MAG TPA: hypothetical protein EYP56_22890 [Planctomycetaceae bacterium]|nr:hypothetical protein [Planctomycetaceae bacterium]